MGSLAGAESAEADPLSWFSGQAGHLSDSLEPLSNVLSPYHFSAVGSWLGRKGQGWTPLPESDRDLGSNPVPASNTVFPPPFSAMGS